MAACVGWRLGPGTAGKGLGFRSLRFQIAARTPAPEPCLGQLGPGACRARPSGATLDLPGGDRLACARALAGVRAAALYLVVNGARHEAPFGHPEAHSRGPPATGWHVGLVEWAAAGYGGQQ